MPASSTTGLQRLYKCAPSLGVGIGADDSQLDQEYFKKLSKGRRYSGFPAVAISEGKIIQSYGTGCTDVTHQFYSGPETVYCIASPSPVLPKGRRQPSLKVKKGNYTDDTIRRRRKYPDEFTDVKTRHIDLGLAPRGWHSNRLGERLPNGELESYRRKSADSINEDQNMPSHDNVSRSTLQRRLSDQKSGSSHSGGTEGSVLYMTAGKGKQRVVSKGELKKKRLTDTWNAGLTSLGVGKTVGGMPLAISGQVPEVKRQPDASSYHIRQKYAEDLERNLFLEELQKAKEKKGDAEWFERMHDIRLDMFYSPEPGETSSSHLSVLSNENLGGVGSRGGDVGAARVSDIQDGDGGGCVSNNLVDRGSDRGYQPNDSNILRDGHKLHRRERKDYGKEEDISDEDITELDQSFNTGLQTPRQQHSRIRFCSDMPAFKSKVAKPQYEADDKRAWLKHFDSTDVLVGNAGQLEESSMSDVETVLHNGQIHERRSKHKMYRKRRRQRKKYKPFLPIDGSDLEEQTINAVKLEQFSIKQLRTMRLKIRKRQTVQLTGLKKFRQVANAVFIVVQFQKILMRLRRNRRRARKKSLKQSKRVQWNADLEIYTQFERQFSPEKNKIPEKFMEEVGQSLINDLSNLPEKFNTHVPEVDSETEMEIPVNGGMRFYTEVQKTEKSDIDNISYRGTRRLTNRRGSVPEPVRPDHIVITLPEQRSIKRDRKRNTKSRSPSRSKSKSKQVVRSTEGVEKPTNKQLPPLVTPSTVATACEHRANQKLVSGSRNHSHGHTTQPVKSKSKRRRRSKSPSKLIKSHSPSGDQQGLATTDAGVTPTEVHIWPGERRQRSYSESDVKFRTEVSLRELLKNADIPAKEVKIEIIERKRQKRKKKMADAAAQRERIAFQREVERVMADRERVRLEELERKEEALRRRAKRRQEQQKKQSPFVSAGVAWNQKQRPKPKTWTNKELDVEISRLSGLFFEMRTCSYIRWNDKDQAILHRLTELEDVKTA